MSYLPTKPNHSLIHVLLDHPSLTRPLIEYTEALMRGPSPFSSTERETLFAYVSGLNQCDFCRVSHTICVEELGAPKGQIDALLGDPTLATAPPKMAPVFRYAKKLTEVSKSVTKADTDAILDAGWDETALVYTAFVVGIANMYNRVVAGLGIPADRVAETGGKMMARDGYAPINQQLKIDA